MDNINNYSKNWMENIIKQYPEFLDFYLNDIVIPGSHDAGTGCASLGKLKGNCKIFIDKKFKNKYNDWFFNLFYLGFSNYIESYINAFSKNQYFPISKQLNDGIRYFDFRIIYLPNKNKSIGETFLVNHSKVIHNYSYNKIFNEIIKFITNNNKEIIILNFNKIYISENNIIKHEKDTYLKKFANFIIEKLKKYIYQPDEFNKYSYNKILLKDVINKKKNLIVIFNYDIWNDSFWNNNKKYFFNNKLISKNHYLSPDKDCKNKIIQNDWNVINNNYLKCYGPPKTNNLEILSLHIQYNKSIFLNSMKYNFLFYLFDSNNSSIESITRYEKINYNVNSLVYNIDTHIEKSNFILFNYNKPTNKQLNNINKYYNKYYFNNFENIIPLSKELIKPWMKNVNNIDSYIYYEIKIDTKIGINNKISKISKIKSININEWNDIFKNNKLTTRYWFRFKNPDKNEYIWIKNQLEIKLNIIQLDFYQKNMINSFIIANIRNILIKKNNKNNFYDINKEIKEISSKYKLLKLNNNISYSSTIFWINIFKLFMNIYILYKIIIYVQNLNKKI